MSVHTYTTNDANFELDVLKSTVPTLVDFWAKWCGPCKTLNPILNEIAESYADRLKIVKVDVDDNSETATKYEIRGIPTLMLFKDGQLQATKLGLLSKSQLITFIDSYL